MKHSALTTALTTVATIGVVVFLIVWLPRQNGKTGGEIFGLQTHEEALECQRRQEARFKFHPGQRVKLFGKVEGVINRHCSMFMANVQSYEVTYLDNLGQLHTEYIDEINISE